MLEKLERKMGRHALPHLMRYVIFGNAIVYVLSLLFPSLVYFLNLMPDKVLHGQIWRLVTFIFVPAGGGLFATILALFCYFWIGEALERSLGTFQFNFYFFLGWIAIVITIFVFYFCGINLGVISCQMTFFFQTLFISLASLYPDMRILLFYFIPLKAKWAGIISAVVLGAEFLSAALPIKMLMLASFIPYLVFFMPGWIRRWRAGKRKREFQRKAGAGFGQQSAGKVKQFWENTQADLNDRQAKRTQASTPPQGGVQGRDTNKNNTGNVTRAAFHRCCVCGITELDDPNMTFRYCSSCNGNYEYCEQHIHNHQHVV